MRRFLLLFLLAGVATLASCADGNFVTAPTNGKSNDGVLSRRAVTAAYDAVSIDIAGAAATALRIQVCAGTSGTPEGIRLEWMTEAAYAANGNSFGGSNLCWASFTGPTYELASGECVNLEIGESLVTFASETNCPGLLQCSTRYIVRAQAEAEVSGDLGVFSSALRCTTTICTEPPPVDTGGRNCTSTQGYWKTHGPVPQGNNSNMWPVTSLKLGTVTYTDAQLLSIFKKSVKGNGLISLAHQLIAAKLNVLSGANPTAIASSITAADALIGSLVVPPVGSGYLSTSTTSALVTVLTAFNEGRTGPGHCD